MNILVEGRSFGIALLWTYIFHVHPHSMMTRFFSEKLIFFFFKGGVITYFIFKKMENKIRNRTLRVTLYLKKGVFENPSLSPRVRLPIGNVSYDSTPLRPK